MHNIQHLTINQSSFRFLPASGIDFASVGAEGRAFLGTACKVTGVGVVLYRPPASTPTHAGRTLAHELGHNLNMAHDGSREY
jgi:hypothetical protein